MATTADSLNSKPFTMEIIPMSSDSIFSEHTSLPMETFKLTKNYSEWKEDFLNDKSLDNFIQSDRLEADDIVNIFPELKQFNYYMMAPTALYKGLPVEALTRVIDADTTSEVRIKIKEYIEEHPNAVLYRLYSSSVVNSETNIVYRTYKIRVGLL